MAARSLAAGSTVSAAVASDGTLHTWGSAAFGLLGRDPQRLGDVGAVVLPGCAGEPASGVHAVAFGLQHAVLATADGRVFAFGSNLYGQLGSGSDQPSAAEFPYCVPALRDVPVASVAAGSYHSCAVTRDGALFVWGGGHQGQLGLGRKVEQLLAPQRVPAAAFGGLAVRAAACGQLHTLVLCDDDRPAPAAAAAAAARSAVFAFGFNSSSQLGSG